MALQDLYAYDYARMLKRKASLPPSEERGSLHTSLCVRCEHGLAYRRRDHLDLTVYCKRMLRPVPSDIVDCTNFEPPNDLDAMVEMAVPIDVGDGVNGNAYL